MVRELQIRLDRKAFQKIVPTPSNAYLVTDREKSRLYSDGDKLRLVQRLFGD